MTCAYYTSLPTALIGIKTDLRKCSLLIGVTQLSYKLDRLVFASTWLNIPRPRTQQKAPCSRQFGIGDKCGSVLFLFQTVLLIYARNSSAVDRLHASDLISTALINVTSHQRQIWFFSFRTETKWQFSLRFGQKASEKGRSCSKIQNPKVKWLRSRGLVLKTRWLGFDESV